MKVFCVECKYYEYCEESRYDKFDVLPPLHSCKHNPKPKVKYTETPICLEKWKDTGWEECEKKNKDNNCKDFKKKGWM